VRPDRRPGTASGGRRGARSGGGPRRIARPGEQRSATVTAPARAAPPAPKEATMESTDLKRAGLKVTHPRMRILQILDGQDGRHVTAEDIYRQLLDHHDDIGLATVYRVLTQFEAAGIVLKHNFEGGQAVYELDRGKHHDHMVDIESGKVVEFSSEEIERLQHEIAARHGYVIEDHSLVLYVRKKKGTRAEG
jgi:Fur family ferric uptake transcriptional regulator